MMDIDRKEFTGKARLGTYSHKAGLLFPVKKFGLLIVSQKYAKKHSTNAPIFLSAALQYIAAEVLELAGNAARDDKTNRIMAAHIHAVVRNDEELMKLLGQVLELPENAVVDDYEILSDMLGQISM